MKPLALTCLLAGCLVGAADVIVLAALSGNTADLHALLWAVAAYGLLGLLGGLVLGAILVRLLHLDAQRTSANTSAAFLAGMGLFVTRYRLYRDLFHEGFRTLSLRGLAFNGSLLVLFVVLFILCRWLGLRSAPRPKAKLRGSGAAVLLLAAVAGAASLITQPRRSLSTPPLGIAPGLESAPNVILIGVDTLRADRLSCYGYALSQTPHMDALAADGVRYADTMAQASWTKPSFATIFTSLYPSSHTATGKPNRLPRAVTTLAEALAASGYHTGGYADNVSIAPTFGFDQGFADYVYLPPSYLFVGNEAASQTALYQLARRAWFVASGGRIHPQQFYQEAAVINRHALAWLEANKGGRFFLFLHYMDPHDPYFEHPYDGRGTARASNQTPDPALAPALSRLYDGEVRYLDEQLGQLFAWLKGEGLYDDALIVLTADHGEEFQEHGGWWHGQTLYQEQIAVPLLVKAPGNVRAGEVVTDLARSLDIAPTILDVAGVPVPQAMMGRSLWSASEPLPYAFAEEDFEGNVLQALRTPTHKLIWANLDNPRGLAAEALFDMVADSGEQHDLSSALPDQALSMRRLLRDELLLALQRAVAADVSTLDATVRDRLHDLGY